MLEKPDIQDTNILYCLRDDYGLKAAQVEFLPLGADRNTAVYRAITDDGTAYFVKLRSGDFDEMTIIAPLPTQSQQLWTGLGEYRVTVSPFVEGNSGYEVDLSDRHWVEFGQALNGIHKTVIPPALTDRLQRESYSDQWRELVRNFQELIERAVYRDPIAAELAAFLKQQHETIHKLIERAESLASVLQERSEPFILCHADIHAGNILIDKNDQLYLVDWDTLIFAPKERDLMFVGGGQFGSRRSAPEEEKLFYQGYGPTQTDPIGLAYYRYERIVQDIAAFCEQVLLTDEGGEDRRAALRYLTGQFQPGKEIDLAFRTEALTFRSHPQTADLPPQE